MKRLAVLVGLVVVAVGIIGIAAPDVLLTIGKYAVTQTGLYIIAILRIAIGLLLIGVSSRSRMPKTLRVVGAVVVIAGISTPFFGVDRARAVLDWESALGPSFIRPLAACLVALGIFLMYAVGPVRRAA